MCRLAATQTLVGKKTFVGVIPCQKNEKIPEHDDDSDMRCVGLLSFGRYRVSTQSRNKSSYVQTFERIAQFVQPVPQTKPQEPITMAPSAKWPFQQIVMDPFYIRHVGYIAYADRLTG